MPIKSILCIFGGEDSEFAALDVAMLLAKSYTAKVRILHISPQPSAYMMVYGEGIIENSHIIATIEKENREKLEKARQRVASTASKHCLTLDEQSSFTDADKVNHVFAEFIHLTGSADDIIAAQGRVCDIVVISRAIRESDTVYDPVVITALFDTGRPVLLVPEGKTEIHYKTVSLAWDGGMEAARAVHNSLQFLKRAENVRLLTAREHGELSDPEAEAGVMEYLKCHDIRARGIIVAAGSRSIAEALLMRAKELETDLLVMGAYGHSRFREMILGGVTNYMLENADIPLLLSH